MIPKIWPWQGPFELLPATVDASEPFIPTDKGVYLWTLEHNGRRKVHYIGYAANVRWRQCQHVVASLGGGYWIPRMPIGPAIEWRYREESPPASQEAAYYRLRHFIDDVASIEDTVSYLRKVDVFVCPTPYARDVEYLLQQRFKSLAKEKDPRACLCSELSLQGSRRVNLSVTVEGHQLPVGIDIDGITDWSLDQQTAIQS